MQLLNYICFMFEKFQIDSPGVHLKTQKQVISVFEWDKEKLFYEKRDVEISGDDPFKIYCSKKMTLVLSTFLYNFLFFFHCLMCPLRPFRACPPAIQIIVSASCLQELVSASCIRVFVKL